MPAQNSVITEQAPQLPLFVRPLSFSVGVKHGPVSPTKSIRTQWARTATGEARQHSPVPNNEQITKHNPNKREKTYTDTHRQTPQHKQRHTNTRTHPNNHTPRQAQTHKQTNTPLLFVSVRHAASSRTRRGGTEFRQRRPCRFWGPRGNPAVADVQNQ